MRPEAELRAQARRAYEVGRVRSAGAPIAVISLLTAVSIFECGSPAASIGSGLLLMLMYGAIAWRGGDVHKTAALGLQAGIVANLVLLTAHGVETAVGADWSAAYVTACSLVGIAAGAWVGWHAERLGVGRFAPLLVGAAIAALTACLGCFVAGLAGVVGATAGIMIAAAPARLVAGRFAV